MHHLISGKVLTIIVARKLHPGYNNISNKKLRWVTLSINRNCLQCIISFQGLILGKTSHSVKTVSTSQILPRKLSFFAKDFWESLLWEFSIDLFYFITSRLLLILKNFTRDIWTYQYVKYRILKFKIYQ